MRQQSRWTEGQHFERFIEAAGTASLFPVDEKECTFVVENESTETKYIVDTQSMRLFGLCTDHAMCSDHAKDVHRADANRLCKKKKQPTLYVDRMDKDIKTAFAVAKPNFWHNCSLRLNSVRWRVLEARPPSKARRASSRSQNASGREAWRLQDSSSR